MERLLDVDLQRLHLAIFRLVREPSTTSRQNDNTMEKLTLPMPENHGFGVYDGKVLMFEPRNNEFFLNAVELGEFDLVYGHRLANVQKMGGGRRFGELV